MVSDEPGLVFSPLEKQGGAYLDYLKGKDVRTGKAVGTPATLDFGWFGALTELPAYQREAVGDITFANRCIVREVKTPADVAASMFEGRLFNQLLYMWYLKVAGLVQNFGFIIRDMAQELHPNAGLLYLRGIQGLEKWQHRYGFSVTCVHGPDEVVEVAKSGMRESLWPKPHELPPILLKKELFEYPPLVIQIAASCHGYAEIRSAELAADFTPAEFWMEAHADDVRDPEEFHVFCDKFAGKYGIAEKLLREVWERANQKSDRPQPPENYFILKDPNEILRLRNEQLKNNEKKNNGSEKT